MATIDECRAALSRLAGNLASAPGDVRAATALDRTVTCHLTDLDSTFTGRLAQGVLEVDAVLPGPPEDRAQIRLAMTGDDLVALVAGELSFVRAWASGRVRLEAGVRDLMRLRRLL
jgi:hypothetical protein